jgi:preprotein translocase subunit YajC
MILNVLLQSAPGGATSAVPTFVFLALIIGVMYIFMIRPQQKKAKDAKKFQEDLTKGEKIVTIAGIHGKINKTNEDGTLQLEVSPGTYLTIEKGSISMEWTQKINKATTEK